VSHIVSGWPDDVLAAKGIDPNAIRAVRQAYAENRGVDHASSLTPDDAVDRLIIAGTPEHCIGRLRNLFQLAARHGFSEITIGVPLGPDVPEAIDLWGNEIFPALQIRDSVMRA
jgi:5,10-methylenetetrahydromethanopterin reductase